MAFANCPLVTNNDDDNDENEEEELSGDSDDDDDDDDDNDDDTEEADSGDFVFVFVDEVVFVVSCRVFEATLSSIRTAACVKTWK